MSLKDYLPGKGKKEFFSVQFQVPKEVGDIVNQIREKEDLTWNKFIEALFRKLIEETTTKRKY